MPLSPTSPGLPSLGLRLSLLVASYLLHSTAIAFLLTFVSGFWIWLSLRRSHPAPPCSYVTRLSRTPSASRAESDFLAHWPSPVSSPSSLHSSFSPVSCRDGRCTGSLWTVFSYSRVICMGPLALCLSLSFSLLLLLSGDIPPLFRSSRLRHSATPPPLPTTIPGFKSSAGPRWILTLLGLLLDFWGAHRMLQCLRSLHLLFGHRDPQGSGSLSGLEEVGSGAPLSSGHFHGLPSHAPTLSYYDIYIALYTHLWGAGAHYQMDECCICFVNQHGECFGVVCE